MHTKKTAISSQWSAISERIKIVIVVCFLLIAISCLLSASSAFADDLKLQDLIDEAVKNNHDLMVLESKTETSKYRIPQAESLPDPMFMVGYQNEGWRRYTYGEMEGAQWMFSASQMFPFPGKLSLKGEMATRDSEGLKAMYDSVKLGIIAKVKELYYDLFLTYKSIDLLKENASLFSRVENAALTRYSTGMAPQQEVIMAQTEKYMLLEREEMLKQKLQSIEAMLNATIGKHVNSPLGRPAEPVSTLYSTPMEKALGTANENSPEIKSKEKMISSAEAKVNMAKKEYYPDFTLAASLFKRNREFEDMWSLTTTINIPLFYRTKQKMAVLEAESARSEAIHELEATKSMIASNLRDNYSMLQAAEKLMDLYKNGLMPKTYQDFESALSGYKTGKVEAITVITRLKSLIDYEVLYWNQFIEREKAIARIEAITGNSSRLSAISSQGEDKK